MDRALQTVFRHGFSHYAQGRSPTPREYHASRQFIRCRTAALGGHKEVCPNGDFVRAHYHSCKHRSCPQCNAIQIERWLQQQQARLLACPHHHIIFTVPHELIPLWLFNRSTFMNLLFQAAHYSLSHLLTDPRYLGATPGILMAFHSWGRDLCIHPHLHALVTDGGLNHQDQWQRPKRSHFLPATVLMRVFRGRFAALLHRALEREQLLVPTHDTRFTWHGIIKQVQRKKWNVHQRERYNHGHGVATYLARYVRGGPVRNSQLSVCGESVVLRYFDHRRNPDGVKKDRSTLRFSLREFIARYLQHVPDKGRQVVRPYGLYANAQSSRLNSARTQHHQQPVKPVAPITWQQYMTTQTGEDYRYCPHCGCRLVATGLAAPRGPPEKDKQHDG